VTLAARDRDQYARLCRLYFPVATLGANAANTGGIAENQLTCTSGGTNPDFEGYGYDENGNRTSLRLRSGETIGITFDVDRPTVKDIPGGSAADVYTTYDLAGRVLSQRFVSAGGQGIVHTWDAAGRLLTETSFGQSVAYQYDAASNPHAAHLAGQPVRHVHLRCDEPRRPGAPERHDAARRLRLPPARSALGAPPRQRRGQRLWCASESDPRTLRLLLIRPALLARHEDCERGWQERSARPFRRQRWYQGLPSIGNPAARRLRANFRC
jgi:YD repeat-containing protein